MRHHKKRTLRKRKGGAWEDYLPSFLKAKPATPQQIINDPAKVMDDAQNVTGKTIEETAKTLGAEPSPSVGTPGDKTQVSEVKLAGGRRKTKKRKHKSRR